MDSHDHLGGEPPGAGAARGLKRLLTGGSGARWRERDLSLVGWLLAVALIVAGGYAIARLLDTFH